MFFHSSVGSTTETFWRVYFPDEERFGRGPLIWGADWQWDEAGGRRLWRVELFLATDPRGASHVFSNESIFYEK